MNFTQTLTRVGLILGCSLGVAMATQAADFSKFQVQKHHQAVLKDCTMCHTQENAINGNAFVVPDDKQCIACHGPMEQIAKKTPEKDEPNPHASHHYGSGISCTACHKEHETPKVYCNECHDFKYKKMP